MDRLKRDPNISMLYSQASGLTYFLINADGGRYRDALVAFLAAIYQGRDRPGTLAELCNSNDAELDDQYRQRIKRFEVERLRQNAAIVFGGRASLPAFSADVSAFKKKIGTAAHAACEPHL